MRKKKRQERQSKRARGVGGSFPQLWEQLLWSPPLPSSPIVTTLTPKMCRVQGLAQRDSRRQCRRIQSGKSAFQSQKKKKGQKATRWAAESKYLRLQRGLCPAQCWCCPNPAASTCKLRYVGSTGASQTHPKPPTGGGGQAWGHPLLTPKPSPPGLAALGSPAAPVRHNGPRRSRALRRAPNQVPLSGFHRARPLPGTALDTALSQELPCSGPAWDLRAVPWCWDGRFGFSSPNDAVEEPVRGQLGSTAPATWAASGQATTAPGSIVGFQ